MMKIFMTGDNHFGKKYDRFASVKEKLKESRFLCLEDMVRKADEEGCSLFAVAGDMFDNIKNINKSDVKRVAGILAGFSGSVVVLPGNHDYYEDDIDVWKDFKNAVKDNLNITLLNEFKEYDFGDFRVYPAYCNSKHSDGNNIGWIKEAVTGTSDYYRIGIAHGAIAGETPDPDAQYFLMSRNELESIPVDCWILGHTHVQIPPDLSTGAETVGYRVYNAGPHEQTSYHNNTEGVSFIITLDKKDGKTVVSARKYLSGKIRYFDICVKAAPDADDALEKAVESAVKDFPETSIVRVTVEGTVRECESGSRKAIYEKVLGRFLCYEVADSSLSEEITVDKIRSEFSELSLAAEFLERFKDNPAEMQMAYELVSGCREESR